MVGRGSYAYGFEKYESEELSPASLKTIESRCCGFSQHAEYPKAGLAHRLELLLLCLLCRAETFLKNSREFVESLLEFMENCEFVGELLLIFWCRVLFKDSFRSRKSWSTPASKRLLASDFSSSDFCSDVSLSLSPAKKSFG